MIKLVIYLVLVLYSLRCKYAIILLSLRLTGKDLFPGNSFNKVLKLNKQCIVDLTPLTLKKVPEQL